MSSICSNLRSLRLCAGVIVASAFCLSSFTRAQLVLLVPAFEYQYSYSAVGVSTPGQRVLFRHTEIFMIHPLSGERVSIGVFSDLVIVAFATGQLVAE